MGDSNDMSGSPRRRRARLECLERELVEPLRLCSIQGLDDGKCNGDDKDTGGASPLSTSHGEQSHQHPQPSDCIKLNVGGTVFTTLLSTLTSVPNTYFESLFSGRWVLRPQADGCFFIDRDPLVFAHILNFLRGQPLPDFSELSPRELRVLRSDAAFYNISSLLDSIPPPPAPPLSEKFCRYAKFDDESGEECITISERGAFAGAFLTVADLPDIDDVTELGGEVLGTNTYSGDDHVVIKLRVEKGCGSGVFVGFFAPDSPLPVKESREGVWGVVTSVDMEGADVTRFTEGEEIEVEFDGPKGMVRVRCVGTMVVGMRRLDEAAKSMFGEPEKAVNWRLYVRLHHSCAVRLLGAYRVTQ